MTMLSTEDCYAATFALLETLQPAGNFKTISRRLIHVEDVAPEEMPAVYQLQINRGPFKEVMNGIAVWVLRAHWYIYVSAPDMKAPTTPLLNPRVDEVTQLLPQDDDEAAQVTVNGISVILTLDGAIEFFEGLLGTKSVARIPIKIIAGNEGA
jgi:hypothetical protein